MLPQPSPVEQEGVLGAEIGENARVAGDITPKLAFRPTVRSDRSAPAECVWRSSAFRDHAPVFLASGCSPEATITSSTPAQSLGAELRRDERQRAHDAKNRSVHRAPV